MNHKINMLLLINNYDNKNVYFAKSVRKIKYLYPAQNHIYVNKKQIKKLPQHRIVFRLIDHLIQI